jgi:KaiC/GvpD/RAD55 family RecA-like ATPase
VDTGIPGLNELIEGGFVKGKPVLVAGSAGTGKTTFCMQFLVSGATKYDEPGVFVTMGEGIRHIFDYMTRYGWDLELLVARNKLSLVDVTPVPVGMDKFYIAHDQSLEFNPDTLCDLILKEIKRIDASRVVIDSITALLLTTTDEFALRHELLALTTMLDRTGCTSLLTSEVTSRPVSSTGELSRSELAEFIAHGVIELALRFVQNEHIRTLTVRKMRGTNHDKGIYLYEIGPEGIKITTKAKYL